MNWQTLPPETRAAYNVSAMQAHCRRVAAAAGQLSRRLNWSGDRQKVLHEAAEVHHRLALSPDSRMLNRMILEVWGLPEPLRPEDNGPTSMEMAQLLELCCFFVQRWEFIPYELCSFAEIVDELRFMAQDGFFDQAHVAGLSTVPRVSLQQVKAIVSSLPVFPAVATRAMLLAANPNTSAAQMEELVVADPVLAGELLKTANSPLYAPSPPIRSIRQAVVFLGIHETSRILAAAAVRPLFRSRLLKPLWTHSLEVARMSEKLAFLSGKADPEEAFIAGLVHDVGRLALWKLPAHLSEEYGSLLEQGCEPMFAETLVCGFDHCAAGREVMEYWLMDPRITEAVAAHHHPERSTSPLAQVLYVAEYWTNSQEDLPSLARLQHAVRELNLSPEKMDPLSASRRLPKW